MLEMMAIRDVSGRRESEGEVVSRAMGAKGVTGGGEEC